MASPPSAFAKRWTTTAGMALFSQRAGYRWIGNSCATESPPPARAVDESTAKQMIGNVARQGAPRPCKACGDHAANSVHRSKERRFETQT